MQNKQCIICKGNIAREKEHHVIPKRKYPNGFRTDLCTNCHRILHKAEMLGLCRLPDSIEEYKQWKSNMVKVSQKGQEIKQIENTNNF